MAFVSAPTRLCCTFNLLEPIYGCQGRGGAKWTDLETVHSFDSCFGGMNGVVRDKA
jgi:hypothetical protein